MNARLLTLGDLRNPKLDGVVGWEYAHCAPEDVSVAVMNVYAGFDRAEGRVVLGEEARRYVGEVAAIEEEWDMRRKVAGKFGSVFGDIGICMARWNRCEDVNYEAPLDRTTRLV